MAIGGFYHCFTFLCIKTKMMGRISKLLLCIGLAAAGCTGIREMARPEKEEGEDIWTGPGANIEVPEGSICYITGIDYPEGYDWKSNDRAESVRCSLVVFADGVPMLKLPVGEGHEVSADADRHRIVAGHLYTEYSTDGYTVLKKDGKPFLKYEGTESIRGMVIADGDVYTLGVPRDGQGFTYRKNGELLIERRTGYAFERLNMDSGNICFAFCQPVTTADGPAERYYIVRDGRISLVALSEETSKVWDIMSHQGEACALVSAGPWNTVEIIHGETEKAAGLPYGAEMLSCRLFQAGDDICIEGMYSFNDEGHFSGIWVEGEQYMLFETGQTISSSCASDTDICCVLNPTADTMTGTIFKSGKTYPMPQGYSCTGNSPLAVHDGILYAGLTSRSTHRPLLWKNGKTDSLKLNGPLCSLVLSSASD